MRSFCLLIIIPLIISLIIFSPAVAMEIVLEQQDEGYLLVLTSENQIGISGYTVQLDFDQHDAIMDVLSVEPFDLFAYYDNGDGELRISGITTTRYKPSNHIPLARIIARNPFSPTITIDNLRDSESNILIGSGSDKSLSPSEPSESLPNSYKPPEDGVKIIVPSENRIPWTMPIQEYVLGIIPPVTPTVESQEVTATTMPSNRSDTNTLPIEAGVMETMNGSGSQLGVSDTPVTKSPCSLLSVIGGILTTMLILRNRVYIKMIG